MQHRLYRDNSSKQSPSMSKSVPFLSAWFVRAMFACEQLIFWIHKMRQNKCFASDRNTIVGRPGISLTAICHLQSAHQSQTTTAAPVSRLGPFPFKDRATKIEVLQLSSADQRTKPSRIIGAVTAYSGAFRESDWMIHRLAAPETFQWWHRIGVV